LLAFLSWKFVEQPFRKSNSSSKVIFSLTASASALLACLGLGIHFADGFASRLSSVSNRYADGLDDSPPRHDLTFENVKDGKTIPMGLAMAGQKSQVFLWGDSHAQGIYSVMDHVCNERGIAGEAAIRNASLPVIDYSYHPRNIRRVSEEAYNRAVFDYIQNQQFEIVVLAARWNYYLENSSFNQERVHNAILAVLDQLRLIVPTVVIVDQVPEPRLDVPRYLAYQSWHRSELGEIDWIESDHELRIQEEFLGLLEQKKGVVILDTAEYFMDSTRALLQLSDGGRCLYIDGNHLSRQRASRLASVFDDLLSSYSVK